MWLRKILIDCFYHVIPVGQELFICSSQEIAAAQSPNFGCACLKSLLLLLLQLWAYRFTCWHSWVRLLAFRHKEYWFLFSSAKEFSILKIYIWGYFWNGRSQDFARSTSNSNTTAWWVRTGMCWIEGRPVWSCTLLLISMQNKWSGHKTFWSTKWSIGAVAILIRNFSILWCLLKCSEPSSHCHRNYLFGNKQSWNIASLLMFFAFGGDFLVQEMLLNLLLRNYLHYNLYDLAEKLRSKTQRSDSHSNQQVSRCRFDLYHLELSTGCKYVMISDLGTSVCMQLCRYLYYLGKIRTIQLEYTDAKDCLLQAARKAPSSARGFRIQCTKWAAIVRLLLGEIPERTTFMLPGMRKALRPYFELTNVRIFIIFSS